MNDTKNIVEAILFASGKGVTIEQFEQNTELSQKEIKKALKKLQESYEKNEGSLVISEHNKKWKLTVRGKYLKYIEKIVSEVELPGPLLRTLSVIAYKSPVMQSDVIHIRGQGAYEHVKELVKQKFITKDEEGRSFLLKITDKFYNYFDVEGDEEIRDIFEKMKQEHKIGQLQIIDEEEPRTKETIGELEVIETKPITSEDHDTIFDQKPRTKDRSEEEKQEEENFLSDIDDKINQLSDRVSKHELPKRNIGSSESEKSDESGKKEEDYI